MLLFTDIDRTLLAHDYSIHPYVLEGFRKARASGLRIILASARSPGSMRFIAEQLDCLDVCACYNGGWVGSLVDGATLSISQLPYETSLAIMQHARDMGTEPVWYGEGPPQALELSSSVLKQLHNVGERPVLFQPDGTRQGPYKIMCIDRRKNAALDRVAERWKGETEVARSHRALLEIGPRHVSKASAVGVLARHLGVPLSACAAAGDSYNDIPMLLAVGSAFTVDNAVPEVKAMCSYVAPSCDEGGLGTIINLLIARQHSN